MSDAIHKNEYIQNIFRHKENQGGQTNAFLKFSI